jgi:hypothetical protein
MFLPRPGRPPRPGEEDPGQEKRFQELSRGYEDSPWLTLLVNFSGFLVIFAGSFTTVFLLGTALTGRTWWPYALILAAMAGTHACLRAIRHRRRRARQPGAGDHKRATRSASSTYLNTRAVSMQSSKATDNQSRPPWFS